MSIYLKNKRVWKIFSKPYSQRDNDALISRGSPHLHLSLLSLAPSVPVELVPLSPPGVVQSLEQVADITVCDTFAVSRFLTSTTSIYHSVTFCPIAKWVLSQDQLSPLPRCSECASSARTSTADQTAQKKENER